MKLKRKILAAITSLLIAASVILTGCATDTKMCIRDRHYTLRQSRSDIKIDSQKAG